MRIVNYAVTTMEEGKQISIWHYGEFNTDLEIENEIINLYPEITYQKFQGFGGAVTDSAAYVYAGMNQEQKEQLLQQYFAPQRMNYRMVRIPLDSCDFSLEHYEASSMENQGNFSLERELKYILPMLRDIQKIAGEELKIMLTPWSPPAFMKTTGERNYGGSLKPEYRQQWAEYICRYIQEFEQLKLPVYAISIQNEAKAVQTWDSCIFTAQEEKVFLRDYLYPELERRGLTDVKIFIWDHNKERAYERMRDTLDSDTDRMISGIAVHWYSGDHFEALQMIRDRYPEKEIILSEACIEYRKFDKNASLANAQKYAHDLIGNINHGLSAFYDWNLLLDEEGGPNHAGNFCEAPYQFLRQTGELKESNSLAYLWHFAHFIPNGAVRIGVTEYTDSLETTAFLYNSRIYVIILNRTKNELPAYLRCNDKVTKLEIPAESIISGVIMEVKQKVEDVKCEK